MLDRATVVLRLERDVRGRVVPGHETPVLEQPPEPEPDTDDGAGAEPPHRWRPRRGQWISEAGETD
jgi:hypothetical protein